MAEESNCIVDGDCPTNHLCFSQTNWFSDLDEEIQSNSDGCFCNTFYSWRGSDCDKVTGEAIFFAIWTTSLLLVVSVLFLYGLEILCIFWTRHRFTFKCNLTFTTVLAFFISNLGAFLWILSDVVSTLKVKGRFLAEPSYFDSDPYKGRHNVYGFIGAFWASAGVFVTTMVIGSLWVETALRTQYGSTEKVEKSIKKYRRFAIAYSVFGVVSGFAAGLYSRVSGDTSNSLGFVLAPFQVLLIAIYITGAKRLNDSIKLLSERLGEKELQDQQNDTAAKLRSVELLDKPFPDSVNPYSSSTHTLPETASQRASPAGAFVRRILPKFSKSNADNIDSTAAVVSQVDKHPVDTNAMSINPKFSKNSSTGANIEVHAHHRPNLVTAAKSVANRAKERLFRDRFESVRDEKSREVLYLIWRTAVLLCVGLALYAGGLILFSLIDVSEGKTIEENGWREYANPDTSFSIVKFAYTTNETGLVVMLVAVAWYLRRSAYRLEATSQVEETEIGFSRQETNSVSSIL